VAVAQRLGDADSEAQVLAVVAERGAALLGVQGAVLVLKEPDAKQVRSLSTTGFLNEDVQAEVAVLPFGYPLPMVHTAGTGTAHFLADRAAALALFPGGAEVYRRAGTQGSASVPLRARGAVFGALAVAFTGRHDWRAADWELLEALAALAGQAPNRILAQRAERKATRRAGGCRRRCSAAC
jgi:GAF domain-containing protein